MRPGQIYPNELEIAILERIARNWPALRPAVGQLHVSSREYTGVGSYTNFFESRSDIHFGDQWLGLNALIQLPGVPNGLGAVLACKEGKPLFLEVYAYGDDHWDGTFDDFVIVESQ